MLPSLNQPNQLKFFPIAFAGLLSTCHGQLSVYQDGPDLLADSSSDDASTDYSSSDDASTSDDASSINMLTMAVPGTPGQDYPIFSEVPDSDFSCEGRVEGGYYADVASQCQPFHICANDGNALQKFSFLCPNGTLFSQVNFHIDTQ
jgi:syndecan 1